MVDGEIARDCEENDAARSQPMCCGSGSVLEKKMNSATKCLYGASVQVLLLCKALIAGDDDWNGEHSGSVSDCLWAHTHTSRTVCVAGECICICCTCSILVYDTHPFKFEHKRNGSQLKITARECWKRCWSEWYEARTSDAWWWWPIGTHT